MSIVVEVDESVEDETNAEYPWIGISAIRNIVLFTEPRTGVVLASPGWPIGHRCAEWLEEDFDTFKGTVTLSN